MVIGIMKKLILTPKKRLEIYNYLLSEKGQRRIKTCGICYALSCEYPNTKLHFNLLKVENPIENLVENPIENLPELYKYKPVKFKIGFWFPKSDAGFSRRKTIIRKAIKDLKEKYNLK